MSGYSGFIESHPGYKAAFDAFPEEDDSDSESVDSSPGEAVARKRFIKYPLDFPRSLRGRVDSPSDSSSEYGDSSVASAAENHFGATARSSSSLSSESLQGKSPTDPSDLKYLGKFPSKGTNNDRYMPGDTLAGRFMVKQDKPFGIEPGEVIYVMDEVFESLRGRALEKLVQERESGDLPALDARGVEQLALSMQDEELEKKAAFLERFNSSQEARKLKTAGAPEKAKQLKKIALLLNPENQRKFILSLNTEQLKALAVALDEQQLSHLCLSLKDKQSDPSLQASKVSYKDEIMFVRKQLAAKMFWEDRKDQKNSYLHPEDKRLLQIVDAKLAEYLKEIKDTASPDALKELMPTNPVCACIVFKQMEEASVASQKTESPLRLEKYLTKPNPQDAKKSKILHTSPTPGTRRCSATNTAKKAQRKAEMAAWEAGKSFDKVKQAGLNAAISVGQRLTLGRWYGGSREAQNIDTVKELIATEFARTSGMTAQEVSTILGTWEDEEETGDLKIIIAAKWLDGLQTFEGDPEVPIGRDGASVPLSFQGSESVADSSYLVYRDEQGDYHSAVGHIQDAGRLYMSVFMRQCDRDAIGKVGQNKGFTIEQGEDGRNYLRLFGIDFGKGWEQTSLVVHEDGSFEQPTSHTPGKDVQFSNYAMFMDTPLKDRMAGVDDIVKQWGFDRVERELGITLSAKVRQRIEENTEGIEEGSHLKPFDDMSAVLMSQVIKPLERWKEAVAAYPEQVAYVQKRLDKAEELVKSVKKMRSVARNRDLQILNVMKSRIGLPAEQYALIEGLERVLVGPEKVRLTSKDGRVQLCQPHLDHKDRISVNIVTQAQDEYEIVLGAKDKKTRREAVDRLLEFLPEEKRGIIAMQKEHIIKDGKIAVSGEGLKILVEALSMSRVRDHIQRKKSDK